MSHDPEDPQDPAEGGPSGTGDGDPRKLDEDAAWREIVAHYGDVPSVDPSALFDPPAQPEPGPSDTHDDPPAEAPAAPPRRPVLEPGWNDPLTTRATWQDEGHFVPPEPPPLPPLEPRRRLAWFGLLGAPVVMLLFAFFQYRPPGWLVFLLVAGFVGGFGYLVATMPSSRPGDGSGDDGAVV